MITFLVPVRSKSVTNDWKRYCSLLERTLKSITNQTSDGYRVVVVCHEIPDNPYMHSKIHYLQVDFKPPVFELGNYLLTGDPGEHDKARKLLAAMELEEVRSSDYVMSVDSDDLISNQLAAFVEQNKSKNKAGWYFKAGYFYLEGRKYLILNKRTFNTLCGTCIIVKPKFFSYLIDTDPTLYYRHRRIELNSQLNLVPLPFPGAIYSMANGENHAMSKNRINNLVSSKSGIMDKLKSIIRKIRKYRFQLITPGFRRKFGLYALNSNPT